MRSDSASSLSYQPALSSKQFHVLFNLERVVRKPYKLNVRDPSTHYKLDGKDCTQQIHSLCVKGVIEKTVEGGWIRRSKVTE